MHRIVKIRATQYIPSLVYVCIDACVCVFIYINISVMFERISMKKCKLLWDLMLVGVEHIL